MTCKSRIWNQPLLSAHTYGQICSGLQSSCRICFPCKFARAGLSVMECKVLSLLQCSGFTILADLLFINSNCSCPTGTAPGYPEFIRGRVHGLVQRMSVQWHLFHTLGTDPPLIPGHGQLWWQELLPLPWPEKSKATLLGRAAVAHQGEVLSTSSPQLCQRCLMLWINVFQTKILLSRKLGRTLKP